MEQSPFNKYRQGAVCHRRPADRGAAAAAPRRSPQARESQVPLSASHRSDCFGTHREQHSGMLRHKTEPLIRIRGTYTSLLGLGPQSVGI